MKNVLCLLLGLLAGTAAFSQPSQPQEGERLGDFLLRQSSSLQYPTGLQWKVPSERASQSKLKITLIDSLVIRLDLQGLKAWIESQVVTGRVILQSTDARWLQVNPAQNPVLGVDHEVVLISRPKTVTVLLADGSLCQVLHASGATAKKYVEACMPTENNPRAWIAQPDGRVVEREPVIDVHRGGSLGKST